MATASESKPMTPPAHHVVDKTDTTYLALQKHLADAPTRDHKSPCAELLRRWGWATKAGTAACIVAMGAWAPLWVQVGKSIERDTERRMEIAAATATATKETAELRVELATLTTQSQERFSVLDSRILANQGTILAEIRKLPRFPVP